jgi:hypothetical protein
MITAKNIAKTKGSIPISDLFAETGPYDHYRQARWTGRESRLIRWSMKSSTMFDGEDKSNEDDD